MSLDSLELLRQLVAIPSINPKFGHSLGGQLTGEQGVTDFLEKICQQQGWAWLRQRVHPDRDNLVALCPGELDSGFGGPMLWEAHQDTVGIEGMRIDPLGGEISQGRVWGRGACDVKGGLAAMLAALSRLSELPVESRPKIVLACTVNEECGFTGAEALAQIWTSQASTSTAELESQIVGGTLQLSQLRSSRPQVAIVAEPTALDVVVAHQGVVRWRCHSHGRAAHSSQPELGQNAIYPLAEVVRAIDVYQREVLSKRPPCPRCGRPSVSVCTISGGTGVNTLPDHATIDVDRRLGAEEIPSDAYAELVDYISRRAKIQQGSIENEPPWMQSGGLIEQEANRNFGEQLAEVVRQAGHKSELVGVRYSTDAGLIAASGVPTVVFGPGSIEQAHTADEWLEIDALHAATEILYQLACGAG